MVSQNTYLGDQTEIGILNMNVISRIITTARLCFSARRHKLTLARMRFVSSALFSHNKRLQRGDICVTRDGRKSNLVKRLSRLEMQNKLHAGCCRKSQEEDKDFCTKLTAICLLQSCKTIASVSSMIVF